MGEQMALLYDELRQADEAGELLRDRPESMWCQQYEETFEQWEAMGGVPADLSTVEALARMSLTLWRAYKALGKTVDDLLASDRPRVEDRPGFDPRVFGRDDDPDAWPVRDVEMPRGWQE